MDVRELYENLDSLMGKEITLQGWIKNHRKQKKCVLFIDATIHYNKKNIKNA